MCNNCLILKLASLLPFLENSEFSSNYVPVRPINKLKNLKKICLAVLSIIKLTSMGKNYFSPVGRGGRLMTPFNILNWII